ncbi:MAG TPA: HlyD family efflux transporter periplasmic adaptor subunit [Candidatus Saccharimonadales bacterium]|nr:HlyD family efflux transporter periplasmic adaptor subunit [Candidatus Saccharimonadales bacterium]
MRTPTRIRLSFAMAPAWARVSGLALALGLGLGLGAACSRPDPHRAQGYVEGEFVYVASPLAGALETLSVHRGDQVQARADLFTLESGAERAARDEAARLLAQARASLEDLRKGKRPTELQSLEAQLAQAQAGLVLSKKELGRQEELIRTPGATAVQDVDRARAAHDQDHQRVAQLEADLKTARLGSRDDQILAAEEQVRAREANLARAVWDLDQKRQASTQAGLVFDTLYREGEWVAAGRPVVVLLPPQNIKVRMFVSESVLGRLHAGDRVQVRVDGTAETFVGKLSYISPQAEYTPPVIYSRETRAKLVFMIEAVFDPAAAARLHPGQPVEVEF